MNEDPTKLMMPIGGPAILTQYMQTHPVTQYKVITGFYLSNLVNDVNREIADGWQPWGGIFALPIRIDDPWCQAMVKFT